MVWPASSTEVPVPCALWPPCHGLWGPSSPSRRPTKAAATGITSPHKIRPSSSAPLWKTRPSPPPLSPHLMGPINACMPPRPSACACTPPRAWPTAAPHVTTGSRRTMPPWLVLHASASAVDTSMTDYPLRRHQACTAACCTAWRRPCAPSCLLLHQGLYAPSEMTIAIRATASIGLVATAMTSPPLRSHLPNGSCVVCC